MSPPSLVTQLRGHLSRACYPVLGRLVGLALRHRLRVGDCVVDTNSPHIDPVTVSRMFLRRYEVPELRFARERLPRDLDIVELGASIGVITAHAARRLLPGRRLVAVEANPRLLPLLRATLATNAPSCDLTILNLAVDYSGAPTVHLDISPVHTNSRLGPAGVAVAATTLSGLLARCGLHQIALIADIEGAELGLILHDAAALQSVQFLLIECHTVENAGDLWTPARMQAALVRDHGFALQAAHSPVYVFTRPAA
ncbi:MAG: FkbM family methyltransferase [Anaerolineales bacterium]|nr:FkbM family methyltransferase [Anaerolineales bacterium]